MAVSKCKNTLSSGVQCHRQARYALNKLELDLSKGDTRVWIDVCGTCDRQVGRQNLMIQGWSIKEAIQCERNPDMDTPTNAMSHEKLNGNLSPRQIRTINQLKARHTTATL